MYDSEVSRPLSSACASLQNTCPSCGQFLVTFGRHDLDLRQSGQLHNSTLLIFLHTAKRKKKKKA